MFGLGTFELFLMAVVGIGLVVLPCWMIFNKAGFPGALSLLMLVPFVGFALLWYLALAKWPNLNT